MMKKELKLEELKLEELEQVSGGDDSGYLYRAHSEAEEAKKHGQIIGHVTWSHMKIIAKSIWDKLWD